MEFIWASRGPGRTATYSMLGVRSLYERHGIHQSWLVRTLVFSSVPSPETTICGREDIVRCSDWTRKQQISLHEGRSAHVILKGQEEAGLGTSNNL